MRGPRQGLHVGGAVEEIWGRRLMEVIHLPHRCRSLPIRDLCLRQGRQRVERFVLHSVSYETVKAYPSMPGTKQNRVVCTGSSSSG
jgi:hypothetical protein